MRIHIHKISTTLICFVGFVRQSTVFSDDVVPFVPTEMEDTTGVVAEPTTSLTHLRGSILKQTPVSSDTVTSFNWNDYYCTTQALTDKESCLQTQTLSTEQTEWCQFCYLTNEEDEEGLCFSPSIADQIQKSLPGKVTCITGGGNVDTENSPAERLVQPIRKSTPMKKSIPKVWRDPIQVLSQRSKKKSPQARSSVTNCNLDGVDQPTCLDSSLVGGSSCIWCGAGDLGGFCFPQEWHDIASRFLDCTSSPSLQDLHDTENMDPGLSSSSSSDSEFTDVDDLFGLIWDIFSSSCYKSGNDNESCSKLTDSETNENCIWCDAIDVFGFCLNPQEAKGVGYYLSCHDSVSSYAHSTFVDNEKMKSMEWNENRLENGPFVAIG